MTPMSPDRSSRREVRNPILALPAAQRLAELDPATRAALCDLLRDLAQDAADRAQKSWRQSKAPMAAYWKAVSIYAKHLRSVVRRAPPKVAHRRLKDAA
jgi:hypothetical protein